jgi:hypothetical protein
MKDAQPTMPKPKEPGTKPKSPEPIKPKTVASRNKFV